MGYSRALKTTLKRIVLVVVFLLGCFAFGNSKKYESPSDYEYTNEINELLYKHDLCKNGGELTRRDAPAYTVMALELASSVYGLYSEEYVSIFADYMIDDVIPDRSLACGDLYRVVTRELNPMTNSVWRAYYKLGLAMESFGEREKAVDLFQRAIVATRSYSTLCKAKIHLAKNKREFPGQSLEEMLFGLDHYLARVEEDERPEVLILLAQSCVEDYMLAGDEENALRFIELGERLTGHVSAHSIIMLLRHKYDIMVKRNHIQAMECLDQSYRLLENEYDSQEDNDDKDWLALALVVRGDYAYTQLLNVDEACDYYIKAYNLISERASVNNPVVRAVGRRMILLLRLNRQYEEAIKLGVLFAEDIIRNGLDENNVYIIFELINTYLSAGELEKASKLFNECHEGFMSFPNISFRTQFVEAELDLKKGMYPKAAEKMEALLRKDIPVELRYMTLKELASAYSHHGDPRAEALSDSLNLITKMKVSDQICFINPRNRKNWLQLCEECVETQLSLPDNRRAIRNAAELNLFRKSLMFRTNEEIRNLLLSDPESRREIERIDSLRGSYQWTVSSGENVVADSLLSIINKSEQCLVNEKIDRLRLFRSIDVSLSDVLRAISENGIAVDFFSRKINEKNCLGAFVYSNTSVPEYVELIEYSDSMPEEATRIIWDKLSPYLQGFSDIYFCADGEAHTLPLEFMYDSTGGFADKDVKIHRVFHLSSIEEVAEIGNSIVFVGVSDYNRPVNLTDEASRGNWTDLGNIDIELATLRRLFPDYSLGVLLNDNATEKNFKALDKSNISTLHISAHGVFLDNSQIEIAKQNPDDINHHVAKRLAKSGIDYMSALILRNGNLSWNNNSVNAGEDDLLTADEIELLSFPKLNLTVLSACETGKGMIDSEGVWGLQRAFRIAGSKNMICSLTKVDDYWTAQFMEAFYQQAAAGHSIYDSFHAAQRWLRRELPDNPEIWAAFILIE